MIIESSDSKFELAPSTYICRVSIELTGFKRLAELGERPLLEDIGEKDFFARCSDLLTDYFAVRRECLVPAAQTAVKIMALANHGPGPLVDAVFDEQYNLSLTLTKEGVISLGEKLGKIGGIEKASVGVVDSDHPQEIKREIRFDKGSVIYLPQTLKPVPLCEDYMPASKLFERASIDGYPYFSLIPYANLPAKAQSVIHRDNIFRERLGLK
jgi:hypothetical protein